MTERITADQLSRLAIVYVRQSTLGQVQNHRESTERQYALAQRAQEFGWPEARIETIDGDLGMSGAVAGRRHGFDELCLKIARSDVGAVFGIEVSRLARNTVEWFQLLDLCRRNNTVIVEDSQVYAPGRNDDDLVLGIKGTVSSAELTIIRARLQGGARNKAMRGALFTSLPAGYEVHGETLSKDPDQQVRTIIERVFSAFLEAGTARATAQLLQDAGVKLPVRRNGRLSWEEAGYGRVQQVLRNPMMAGVYAWGRKRDPEDGPLSERWEVWIPDHHEGYVELAVWFRIQEQLFHNQNKRASARGALREGRALLQGLAVCGHCGRSMNTKYNHSWAYSCDGRTRKTGSHDGCFTAGGVRIDKLVARSFLEAVGPAAVDAAMQAEQLVEAERQAALLSHRHELERCRYDAARAERRYKQVDPDNRLIASTLEREWEFALRALEHAEGQLEAAEAELPQAPAPELLAALGQDLPALWDAEATTPRDRKRLLSCLLDEVILSIDRDARQIGVLLQWKGGRSDEHRIPLRLERREVKRDDADTVDLVRRLAAFYPDWQIARILNRQKRVTARGLPFTASRVGNMRGRRGIPVCPPREAEECGAPTLGVAEAAAELGVTATTLYRWIRMGLVPSVQPDVSGAPMRVRLTDAVRSRFCPNPPDGYVPLNTAVSRLGVTRQTIWNHVRVGKMQAICVTHGSRRGLHVRIGTETDAPLLSGLELPATGQTDD
ncbi:MAG: recombinase family protein [Rhodospirillaceae bacterium]|nr:recombinase family protein [Rhodospirillaceae bacterium]